MSSKPYNVGVIGYGLSAKVFQIPIIEATPAFKLHAIVQRTPKPNDDASKNHPDIKIYHDTSEIVKDPEIDVIVISTAPDTHFAFAKSALENGKHVIIEKPVVPTSGEAQQLIELGKKHQLLICVYQNRRWDSDFLTFLKLKEEGSLGRIVEFETHFDRWKPQKPENWKGNLRAEEGGGPLYDLGSHLIDQAVVAFGLPLKVTGIVVNQGEDRSGEEDGFTVLLHYPMGLLVTVKAGIISPEAKQLRYWVRGTKGSYKKYFLDVQEDQLKAGAKYWDEGFGIEPYERAGLLTRVVEGGGFELSVVRNIEPQTYTRLYEGFAQAIEKRDEELVPVKLSEARDVLRIIELARESAKAERTIAF